MKSSFKSGISLIAVLMFMLAATTASIVVFRWISQENFSSGARLKSSEAYQASQAGLEAVQGWLANKGADAGALIKTFEEQPNPKRPVLLVNNSGDLLGGMQSTKRQSFQVYLTDVNTEMQPYRFKFLSIGTARNGSKHSQVGIFNVDGLYKVTANKPLVCETPDIPAFFGGLAHNTQGRFSSATINGDAIVNGLSTKGNLIVTGNAKVLDNAEMFIGCKSKDTLTRAGDMYIFGYFDMRGFSICGDAYIGGLLTTTSSPQFLRNLYANGGINSNGLCVHENVTLGADLVTNGSQITFDGNMVMDPPAGRLAQITIVDGSHIDVGGSIWSMSDLYKAQSGNGNGNGNDKYLSINMGGAGKRLGSIPVPDNGSNRCKRLSSPIATSGKSLFIPSPLAYNCAMTNNEDRNCGIGNTARWYQSTGSSYAHFSSWTTYQIPTLNNKLVFPNGANPLTSMADQISECTRYDGTQYKCVPDPLKIQDEVKAIWVAKAVKLDSLVNTAKDTTMLPKSCIRLVARPKDPNGGGSFSGGGYDSHWLYGDAVSNGSCANYPSKGITGPTSTCSGTGGKYDFVRASNDCYKALIDRQDGLIANNMRPKDILYQNGDVGEKFLPLLTKNPEERSVVNGDYFNGNFIFAFTANMGTTMKLPATTDNSKVFLYFQEGATGSLPLESSCLGLPANCKRNYFIFSEKDMKGSSGTATINGAIFLANGSRITGSLPDAYIEFNPDLYKALTDAGIVSATDDDEMNLCTGAGTLVEDNYYIPSTSHLKVKMESQYANEKDPSDYINVKPAILVLPRVVYLTESDLSKISSGQANIKDYYKVLYLNGAAKPQVEEFQPRCPMDVFINGADGDNPCFLTSQSTACGSSSLCQNHPFYVVLAKEDNSSAGSSSSTGDGDGPGEEEAEIEPTLSCAGTVLGTEGTALGGLSNSYVVTCSHGEISNLTFSHPTLANVSNPTPGTHPVTASATCDSKAKSASCPPIEVAALPVIELSCSNLQEWAVAGFSVAQPALACSDGSAVGGTPIWTRGWGSTWTVPSTAFPGTSYAVSVSNVICGTGVSSLSASCGNVKVAGLACTGIPSGMIKGSTIPKPTLTCNNGANATNDAYTPNSLPYTVPSNAATGTKYNIKATANCGAIAGLEADCGTVTVQDLPPCAFDPLWCPGITWSNIKTGSFSHGAAQCHFISTMSSQDGHKPHNNNNSVNWMINGQTRSNCDNGCNSSSISKADGGYYIYTPASTGTWWTQWGNASAKPSNCTPPDGGETQETCTVYPGTGQNASVGSCFSYTPDNCNIQLGYWNGNNLTVDITGGCTSSNYAVAKGGWGSPCKPSGAINITIVSGNATDFQINCW